MNDIKVIGTAIVNGVHWLKRLVDSVDYPTDIFVIFNNNGRGQITAELEEIKANKTNRFIKEIVICHMPTNIGCPAAWNLIIKSYITYSQWIIVNHDVAFTPGFLRVMMEKASNTNTGIVFGQPGPHNIGMWDIFLIKDWVIDKFGLFDENFYPAYCEDIDYVMRLINFDPIKDYVNLPYYHGETTEYSQSGSQTWRNDLDIKSKIDYGRWLNENVYMKQKWGDSWRSCAVYKYPFNDNMLKDSGYYKYDINYIRQKYIGF